MSFSSLTLWLFFLKQVFGGGSERSPRNQNSLCISCLDPVFGCLGVCRFPQAQRRKSRLPGSKSRPHNYWLDHKCRLRPLFRMVAMVPQTLCTHILSFVVASAEMLKTLGSSFDMCRTCIVFLFCPFFLPSFEEHFLGRSCRDEHLSEW